jgi:hypothetical protein
MIEDWVPFHRRLAKGKKRSLPRGVRFVYLELALEARATEGTIELPLEWDTLDAVHDLLGGGRAEIKNALEAFTKVDDTGVSPLEIVKNSTQHALIVTKWGEWAGPKSSTRRVREFRERQKNAGLAPVETLRPVSHRNDGNALEEKRREEKTVEKAHRNGVALLPGLTELEREIRRHSVFASLNAHTLAEQHAGWMVTAPQKLAWAIRAIDDCAAAHTALGLTAPELQRKLVSYMRNARRPKDEKPVRAVVESEPERAPTEAELAENRRRMEERDAKAKAERERRAKLGQSLEGPKR